MNRTTDQRMEQNVAERFLFRTIRKEEIPQAIAIEQTCFPPHEASPAECMRRQIAVAAEFFLVAEDRQTGKLAGFLNGIATDEERFRDAFFTDSGLHDVNGKNIMLLGLDVLPEYRGQGLARALVERYLQNERANGRKKVFLTCLQPKVDMYLGFGFADHGIADSTWGGEEWHEMCHSL